MEKAKKPYKHRLFWPLSSKRSEKSKQWIFFAKNCLTLFVSGREKNAFSCTLSVLAKIFLDQNSVKQETL